MISSRLTHPQTLAALAAAGHGSTVLISDGHYAAATAVNPREIVVHLNLEANHPKVTDVLDVVRASIPIESWTAMQPAGDPPAMCGSGGSARTDRRGRALPSRDTGRILRAGARSEPGALYRHRRYPALRQRTVDRRRRSQSLIHSLRYPGVARCLHAKHELCSHISTRNPSSPKG
jgi:hypothetical protein